MENSTYMTDRPEKTSRRRFIDKAAKKLEKEFEKMQKIVPKTHVFMGIFPRNPKIFPPI